MTGLGANDLKIIGQGLKIITTCSVPSLTWLHGSAEERAYPRRFS
jgi:hypothetical protein